MEDTDKRIRIDLHAHGPIGFEPYWLRKQGYADKNPLALWVDACLFRGIGLCAVISEQNGDGSPGWVIPRNSVHERFNLLIDSFPSLITSSPEHSYILTPLEANLIKVSRGTTNKTTGKTDYSHVYLITGQTVVTREDDGTRLDHLVIGANDLPNNVPLRKIVGIAKGCGYLQILEHPTVVEHYGAIDYAEDLSEHFDAVEGHDAQLCVPDWMSRVPKLGAFTRNRNQLAAEWAVNHNLTWIANSDAHRFEDIGLAYTEFPREKLDFGDTGILIASLRGALQSGEGISRQRTYAQFWPSKEHPMPGWWDWTTTFQWGIMQDRYKKG